MILLLHNGHMHIVLLALFVILHNHIKDVTDSLTDLLIIDWCCNRFTGSFSKTDADNLSPEMCAF